MATSKLVNSLAIAVTKKEAWILAYGYKNLLSMLITTIPNDP